MITVDLITKEDLQHFKAELLEELKKTGTANLSAGMQKSWLRSAEVRKLLNISPGTLQNLRISGALQFTKIGGMMYYKKEDIEKKLEDNLSTEY